jgi:hypothetical protein
MSRFFNTENRVFLPVGKPSAALQNRRDLTLRRRPGLPPGGNSPRKSAAYFVGDG